jgi:integration host factor subunit alpha
MAGKTLTKADVVAAIYPRLDRTGAEVKGIVEILLRLMKQAIKKDNSLLISGFGKFEAYTKRARKGRNPQTGDSLTLQARRVLVFRVSKTFRALLNEKTGNSPE